MKTGILSALLLWSAVANAHGGLPPRLTVTETPAFSPVSGTYSAAQSVVITDSSSDASIYYTTNGSTPTTSSTKYTAAIKVSATETIKAIAVAKGDTNSAVASATYTIETPTATPIFLPLAGTYAVAQSVSISDTTTGATIYYTTNGSTPTTSSTKYSTPIKVSTTETLKAIAVASSHTTSAVASATYTIKPVVATPVFSPKAGTYTTKQSVTITDGTTGTTIYYTTNGTTPTTGSTKYAKPIDVSETETLKAIAVATGYTNSAVASAAYTISSSSVIETLLYSFGGYLGTGYDGIGPNGLIQASNGNLYGTTGNGGDYDNCSEGNGDGTLFQVTPTGTETILYSFRCGTSGNTVGAVPVSGVILGKDGDLYGTSEGGWAYGYTGRPGSVFKSTLTGQQTILHAFPQPAGVSTDGECPTALVLGSDGNFYGTTEAGGTTGLGTVFQVTPTGAEKVLHTFAESTDGATPHAGLIEASDGTFYGTTSAGGKYGVGTVFKITSAGSEAVVYSFSGGVDGSKDGAFPYAPLTQGPDGNLYGTTLYGGASSTGTVFQLTPAGEEKVIYSFGKIPDGNYPLTMILASDGNFYGFTEAGGSVSNGFTYGNGTVFEITTAGVEKIVYSFLGLKTGLLYGDGFVPSSLIEGRDGNLYGTTQSGGEYDEGTVFKLTGVISGSSISQ